MEEGEQGERGKMRDRRVKRCDTEKRVRHNSKSEEWGKVWKGQQEERVKRRKVRDGRVKGKREGAETWGEKLKDETKERKN